jgi:hypothetical protein
MNLHLQGLQQLQLVLLFFLPLQEARQSSTLSSAQTATLDIARVAVGARPPVHSEHGA